jgi:hypothetical protein
MRREKLVKVAKIMVKTAFAPGIPVIIDAVCTITKVKTKPTTARKTTSVRSFVLHMFFYF